MQLEEEGTGCFLWSMGNKVRRGRRNDSCDKPIFRSSNWYDGIAISHSLIKSGNKCEHNDTDFKVKKALHFLNMFFTSEMYHLEFTFQSSTSTYVFSDKLSQYSDCNCKCDFLAQVNLLRWEGIRLMDLKVLYLSMEQVTSFSSL